MVDHDTYCPLDTPMGPVFVAWNDHGVCRVEPGTDEARFEAGFKALFGRPVTRAEAPPELLDRRAGAHRLAGRPRLRPGRAHRHPGHPAPATPGPTARWRSRSASRARPGPWAGRSGATGCPVIVPCHRVVASTGLGGFGLGLDAKRALLAAEGYPGAGRRRSSCGRLYL